MYSTLLIYSMGMVPFFSTCGLNDYERHGGCEEEESPLKTG